MKNEDITHLIEKQEANIKELFSVHQTALRAKIEAENEMLSQKIDTLVDYQKMQNGRTLKAEQAIRTLENETRIWRLIQRNPKSTLIIVILSIIGFASSGTLITLLAKIF
jgi:hypothetical protein